MTPIARRKLFVLLAVSAAGLVSIITCFTMFVVSDKEQMPVAAAAFAVAGLISIMPWQLAQAMAPSDKTSRTCHDSLIRSGAWMAMASLLFVTAAMLRHLHFHVDEMFSFGNFWNGIIWWCARLVSAVCYLIAALYFMLGVVPFTSILSEIVHADDESGPKRSQ